MNLQGLSLRLERGSADRQIRRQVDRVERYLAGIAESASGEGPHPEPVEGSHPELAEGPVLFFNASTRVHTLSLNAAFSLLASWSVRLAGVSVRYVVCHSGMEQCILGTRSESPQHPPPCGSCVHFSEHLFPRELVIPLTSPRDPATDLDGEPLESLVSFQRRNLPVGQLCLPGLRWALRRHHLSDDAATRQLFRQYLGSAGNLADQFERILEETRPRALVVFNGIMYPEAVARAVAQRRGIPVITHEVGLQPFSTFFSHDHATFRQVNLRAQEELKPDREEQLEAYLQERRRGRFSMAGIEFWPEIESLPEALTSRIAKFRQMVPIFTNVVFDTSQTHANVLFQDMFDWLEALADPIAADPETLFVLRAHPDEDRPGKVSRESVADWFHRSPLRGRENVVFIPPSEYVSSYELIDRAKCVLVYSSSVGLEASVLGVVALCAGRARYTQADTVFFPSNRHAYLSQLEQFLAAERIEMPGTMRENAKAFLYHELYHASLDLSEFLRPYPSLPGMVLFSDFEPVQLDAHPTLNVIRNGVLEGAQFVLDGRELQLGELDRVVP